MANGQSNVIDAKNALKALIAAIPEQASEKWDLDWGFTKTPDRTWVYLGEVNWDVSEWATNRSRQEEFSIRVVVNVKRTRTGEYQQAEGVERECSRIAGLIEAAVKANPNLGLPAVVTTGFAPRRMDSWPADDMGEGQFEADVRVTARL